MNTNTSTRTKYDTCTKNLSNLMSSKIKDYMLFEGKYYNDKPCMVPHLNCGNCVSKIKGNMVDLESDLRGQTRALCKCDKCQYQPSCANKYEDPNSGLPCPSGNDVNLMPLSSCQMNSFKKLVLPDPVFIKYCRP